MISNQSKNMKRRTKCHSLVLLGVERNASSYSTGVEAVHRCRCIVGVLTGYLQPVNDAGLMLFLLRSLPSLRRVENILQH